jgi:hypothetical protein
MKSFVFSSAFVLILGSGIAQNFVFEHSGGRAATVRKEKLRSAKTVYDLVNDRRVAVDRPDIEIVSVEVSMVGASPELVAKSAGRFLSKEQVSVLRNLDLGSEIAIRVQYKGTPGNITELEQYLTPAPDVEAEFPGGEFNLINYLKENITGKVSGPARPGDQIQITLGITVNEDGTIEGNISRTSEDPLIDKLALDALNKMPKWKPAENARGEKIRQKFIIRTGDGC